MATKIYGASDDLIEFDGDVSGEDSGGSSDGEMVVCDDGTILAVRYGKEVFGKERGIWALTLLKRGSLFDRIDTCEDEDADPYSDIAHFRDGLKRAWVCREVREVS